MIHDLSRFFRGIFMPPAVLMINRDRGFRKKRPYDKDTGFKSAEMILLLCLLITMSCADFRHENPVEPSHGKSSRLRGFAQKGPFQQGAAVKYSPLNARLEAIRTETGEVLDGRGYFEMPCYTSVFLHRIEVSGSCYNEMTDKPSECMMQLKAVTDHEAQVNVLTTLAADRIAVLVRQGFSFGEARSQAEKEVLSVFHIEDPSIGEFSSLDITRSGSGHAALLAISAVLLGDGSDTGCRDLLTGLSEDLCDGSLDDSTLLTRLTDNERKLNVIKIRENLTGYYLKQNQPCQVPFFEQYALRLLPFYVIFSDPLPGETGVPVHSVIRVQMNKPFTGLPAELIEITGPSAVDGRITMMQSGDGFIFEPARSLEYGSTYTLIVHNEFAAIDSSCLEMPFTCAFTTRGAPELGDLPDTLMVTEPYHAAVFNVPNAGEDTLFWQIDEDLSWMNPAPVQGSCLYEPDRIQVYVDTAGLEPGDYYGNIRIRSNAGEDSIVLHLLIPKHPVLQIDFESPDLGYGENERFIEIGNSGTGSLVWSAYSDQPWLTPEPSSGRVEDDPVRINLTVTRQGLPGGRYTGQFIIQSDGGNDTLEITMNVIHRLVFYPDSGSGEDASVCSLPCTIPPGIYSGPCTESSLGDLPLLRLESWTYSGYPGTFRSYVRFDLTGLPSDASIDSAKLDLFYPGIGESGHEGDNGFLIQRVLSSWQAAELNWNNQPDIAPETADQNRITVMESVVLNQNYHIRITGMVRYWQANPDQNYGMRLSLQTEQFYRRVMIASSESADDAYRPKITIFYRESGE